MTRLQKRKLTSALLVVLTILLLVAMGAFSYYFFSVSMPRAERRLWINGLYGFVFVYVLFLLFLNSPKKVELTGQERRQPVAPTVNLSNTFAWRVFILTALTNLTGGVMILVPHYLRRGVFDWLALCLIYTVPIGFYLVMLLYLRRNEYIIEGRTLIVREYKFFRLDADLCIPIDTIENVYIKNNYSLMPRVILEIRGLKRELRCLSHSDELAIEILLRQTP